MTRFVFLAILLLSATACVADPAKVPDGVSQVLCTPGQSVELSGVYTGDGIMDSCALMERRIVLQQHGTTGQPDHYDFVWAPTAVGIYPLKIVYSIGDKSAPPSRELTVICTASPPAILPKIPQFNTTDLDGSLLNVDPSVVHADITFNGATAYDGAAPFKSMFHIATLDYGVYIASFTCTTSSGEWYQSPICPIFVPLRITLPSYLDVKLNLPSETTSVQPSFPYGLQPKSVEFSIDGEIISHETKPPFSAKLDLSTYPSGTHNLVAIATAHDGTVFKTDNCFVNLTNKADDLKRQAAQINANAQQLAEAQSPTGIAKSILATYFQVNDPNLSIIKVYSVKSSGLDAFPMEAKIKAYNSDNQLSEYDIYYYDPASKDVCDTSATWDPTAPPE
jgi:hypothetical protein